MNKSKSNRLPPSHEVEPLSGHPLNLVCGLPVSSARERTSDRRHRGSGHEGDIVRSGHGYACHAGDARERGGGGRDGSPSQTEKDHEEQGVQEKDGHSKIEYSGKREIHYMDCYQYITIILTRQKKIDHIKCFKKLSLQGLVLKNCGDI